MKIQDIYELMDRFETSSMTELDLEMEGVKTSLKKNISYGVTAGVPFVNMEEVAMNNGALVNSSVRAESVETKEEGADIDVEAPLVGTFYSAPSPEGAPFVTVGSEVKKGDVVGIIEAMKLMNEITAPCDGIITSIHVENGQMVEYHQVLMNVK